MYQNRATAPRRRNQPSGGLSVRPRQSPRYHSDLPQVLRVRGWFPEFAPGDEEILAAAKRDLARLRKDSFYWSFERVISPLLSHALVMSWTSSPHSSKKIGNG